MFSYLCNVPESVQQCFSVSSHNLNISFSAALLLQESQENNHRGVSQLEVKDRHDHLQSQ